MTSRPVWFRTPALLAALAFGSLSGCSGAKTKDQTVKPVEPIVPIKVGPIAVRGVERVVEGVGSLKGWDEVTIGAKRAGRVARVLHDMGDRVRPGEPLLALESTDADLAVEQAQRRLDADLAKLGLREIPKTTFDVTTVPSVVQAKVALERARMNLSRERSLRAKGAGTGQDFQNAENDEQSSSAAYDTAVLNVQSTWAAALASKVALDVAKQNRVDLQMLVPKPSAPPQGLKSELTYAVTRRTVSEGQMVKEGEALFDLAVENPLRLWSNIPEQYASNVALGQEVRLLVASTREKTFTGKVVKINPAVDPVSRTFQVEVAVANDSGSLRPGGFAKVEIVTLKSDDTITVPPESIRRFGGTVSVFVIDDAGIAKQVEVAVGQQAPGWVEVRGDLPKSGKVAIDGLNSLANGTKTKLREETPAPASDAAKPEPAKTTPG